MDNLGHKRKSYERHELNREDLSDDPIKQFAQWFSDAEKVGVIEPNAMALATATKDGRPSVRIVLLKGFADDGFAFYTNYESQKAEEMQENPHAALVFWWDKLERQVRIDGKVEKLPKEESEKYFHSRPKGSQLSAWASPQSRKMTKEELQASRDRIMDKYDDNETIPLPDHWGGYLLRPDRVEFWQGRSNRYHDRFLYELNKDASWEINRLAP